MNNEDDILSRAYEAGRHWKRRFLFKYKRGFTSSELTEVSNNYSVYPLGNEGDNDYPSEAFKEAADVFRKGALTTEE